MAKNQGDDVRADCDLDEVRRDIQELIAKLDRVIEDQRDEG
jgi:hypothetical protein